MMEGTRIYWRWSSSKLRTRGHPTLGTVSRHHWPSSSVRTNLPKSRNSSWKWPSKRNTAKCRPWIPTSGWPISLRRAVRPSFCVFCGRCCWRRRGSIPWLTLSLKGSAPGDWAAICALSAISSSMNSQTQVRHPSSFHCSVSYQLMKNQWNWMKNQWNSMKNQWNSMKNQWNWIKKSIKINEIQLNSMKNQRNSMKLNAKNQWNSMKFDAIQWNSMKNQWNSMKNQRNSMKLNAIEWNKWKINKIQWNSMKNQLNWIKLNEKSIKLNEIEWKINEIKWKSIKLNEKSIKFNEKSMKLNEIEWKINEIEWKINEIEWKINEIEWNWMKNQWIEIENHLVDWLRLPWLRQSIQLGLCYVVRPRTCRRRDVLEWHS